MSTTTSEINVHAGFAEMTPDYMKGPGQAISELGVPPEHQSALRGYRALVWTRYSGGEIATRPWQSYNQETRSFPVTDVPGNSGGAKLETNVQFYAYDSAGVQSRSSVVEFD